MSELKHKIIPYPKDNLNCGWGKKEKKKNDTTNAQLEHGCSACV